MKKIPILTDVNTDQQDLGLQSEVVYDRDTAARAVSDAMIDATSVSGTPDQCRARIEAYRRSGIDLPIISPFARGPDARSRFEAAITCLYWRSSDRTQDTASRQTREDHAINQKQSLIASV